jgi:hypothetical protein
LGGERKGEALSPTSPESLLYLLFIIFLFPVPKSFNAWLHRLTIVQTLIYKEISMTTL